MLSMSQPVSAPLNGHLGNHMDGSGTINPAALTGLTGNAMQNSSSNTSPRGVKRDRSPEEYSGNIGIDDEEAKRRKRGRPPKGVKVAESPGDLSHTTLPSGHKAQTTPQLANQQLPQPSPSQASPTKSTPTKGAVLKALPTVRDHTTDQLNPEGDEFIPRETDEAGERKVTQNGAVLDGRQYRCRTFYVPNRGDKLFMLATECARVLGYRDSYLLFNKNRSLHKIIANQAEKDDLISQEILPYSYRSRQIAIVTARSMFRQFGSRLIVNGRRVRDDYWEGKARKQGFTEEDAAGEKRPGAAKQREAAAAAHESNIASLTALPQQDIIYSNAPGLDGMGASIAPLPMINAAPTDDLRPRDYSSVQRPRHEMTGPPYMDQTRQSGLQEVLSHAAQTAEFNRSLTQQRNHRGKFMQETWHKPHDSPVQEDQRPSIEGQNAHIAGSQALQSPHLSTSAGLPGAAQHAMMPHQQQQNQQQMMTPHGYPQGLPQSSMVGQSPVRSSSIHHQIGQQQPQQQQRSTSVSHPQNPSTPYGGYGQQHGMWPPPQPQPSPGPTSHYSQYMGAPQQSPHMQQRHSPMGQHPGQPHTPQQVHPQASGGMGGYSGMAQGMYPGGAQQRQMYGTPQQYMQPHNQGQPGVSGPGGQQGMQGYAGYQGNYGQSFQ